MANESHKGYDAFANRREQDDLDRWQVSAQIFQTIISPPADFSARVGVFGRWGEGKSTVLGFLERMLEHEGSVVFWFNPWANETFDDLLADFGRTLLRALDAKGLLAEGTVKGWLRKTGEKFSGTGVSELAEGGLEFLKVGKLYNASISILGDWLNPDGEQLKKITETLGDKRIVILIDDLDRCTPELLPKLLLCLRELLDLPGFTFILAFDDDIVGKALTGLNPAWGAGSNFLDKILDFKFHLLPVSQANKVKLLHRSLALYCSFVPPASTKGIEDLLPENPRKLKTLVRSFAAIKSQIERHNVAELAWADIWIAQLLRQQSYAFFEKFLEGKNLEEESGIVFSVVQENRRRGQSEKDYDKNQTIKGWMVEVGISEPIAQSRLVALVEAARARTGMHFRYYCDLILRSPLMTWKEFEHFSAEWEKVRTAAKITDWIHDHVALHFESLEAIEAEFFETLINAREAAISQAIAEDTTEELNKRYEKVRLLLTMLSQFLDAPHRLTAERLKVLLDKTSKWIAFRKNDSEKAHRNEEAEVLLRLTNSLEQDQAIILIELMKPWSDWENFGYGAEELPLQERIRKAAVDSLLPKVYVGLYAFMSEEHSVRKLGESGKYMAFKYALYGETMLPWPAGLEAKISEILAGASSRASDYEKAKDLLKLTMEGALMSRGDVDSKGVRKLLLNYRFVQELWIAVSSTSIQWRMQMSLLMTRKQLLDYGVPEIHLPLTEELRSRLPEFEANGLNR